MGATALQNVRTREEWAEIINADWRKSIEAIFETADHLIAAREELGEREFYQMVRTDLTIPPGVVKRLMHIGRDPRLRGSSSATLPTSWRVLDSISTLNDDDFAWATERGLITASTSLRAVGAIKGARGVPEGETWGRERKPSTLPNPGEANNIARETGRLVAASDGNVYSGATEEESADHVNRRQRTYGIRDAIDAICDCGVTPEQWLSEAEDHWLHDFRLGSIDEASAWLTKLKVALAKRRGILDA